MANSSSRIGIGITTYQRPDYFTQCLEHVIKNTPKDTKIYVYNDGSTEKYPTVDKRVKVTAPKKNRGVAHAKNTLLKQMLADGCDYLVILEDDILIINENALSEYIRVSKETGIEHLSFYNHGPANKEGKVYGDENVSYYPACVGAFSLYTRNCLESLAEIEKDTHPYPGLMDENFHNAWEHVHHTKRLGDHAFTSPFGLFADITGSERYLKEIPGSIEKSSIRPTKEWKKRMEDGLKYWEEQDGEKPPITYEM